MAPHKRKTPTGTLAVLALVGAALLAGCAGLAGTDESNRAPHAALDADKTQGWTGEEFTFDAQASSDPDGNITSWQFDFGDGLKQTVTAEDAARVKHAYDAGGEYLVTVKVVDDGTGDGLERESDEASVLVAVDERFAIAGQVARAQALNTTAGSRMALDFDVGEGADLARVNVTVQNVLLAGASEVRLRLLDPAGNVLAEQVVTLPDDQEQIVAFDAALESLGGHTFEAVAESGSVQVSGELVALYSEDADLEA